MSAPAPLQTAVVDGLKKRGFSSPYLRTFVVARINPLRFIKGDLPALPDLLATMTKRARGMSIEKIRPEDVALAPSPSRFVTTITFLESASPAG